MSVPYDMIIHIPGLLDVAKGWNIRYPLYDKNIIDLNAWYSRIFASRSIQDQLKVLQQTQKKNEMEKRIVTTVLGGKEKGKSFVLGRIFRMIFEAPQVTNPEGLSIIMSRDPLTDIAYGIDTCGFQTPVENNDPCLIQNSNCTENFIQNLSFELSDIILFIVNKLEKSEQDFINELHELNQGKGKDIIVVHNLSNIERIIEMEKTIKYQVEGQCKAEKIKDPNQYHYWVSGPIPTKHVVLGKQGFPAGKKYNQLTFEFLRNVISFQNADKRKAFNIIDRVLEFTNANINQYLTSRVSVKVGEHQEFNKQSICQVQPHGGQIIPLQYKLGNLNYKYGYEKIYPKTTEDGYSIEVKCAGYSIGEIDCSISYTTKGLQVQIDVSKIQHPRTPYPDKSSICYLPYPININNREVHFKDGLLTLKFKKGEPSTKLKIESNPELILL